MAANFTKKEANLLLQESGPGKYLFADEQKDEIMTFYKDRSYITAYGSGVPVSMISKGSVTYTLNSGEMTRTAKGNTIGMGSLSAEQTGFIQKTVYLSAPHVIDGGFQIADLMQGMKNAVATKFTQALNTFDKDYERGGLRAIVGSADIGTANVIDPAAIVTADDAKAAKTKIIDAAFEMSEIQNAKYALDGFDESRIFIDLSSKLFNRLVDERLIEDAADSTFKEGIFRIGTMGGFTVRRNEFLGKPKMASKDSTDADTKGIVHAVIATDVTAVAPRAFIAANAGKLPDLSEDEGYYVEQKFASEDGNTEDIAVMAIEVLLTVFGTAI